MLELCNVATFILSVITKRGMTFPPSSTVRFSSQPLSKDVMHIGADDDEIGEDGLDDNVFAQLLAFQRRQRKCFGCGSPEHTISECPDYEIKKKSVSAITSSKKPLRPQLAKKSINAMISSPGEEMCSICPPDNDKDDAAVDVFTSDIDLDQKVASVIRHEDHSSSDESSIDDFDLHRDGFTFGDFDTTIAVMTADDHSIDFNHRVAAVSADIPASIDDVSASSSDSDDDAPVPTITLDNYVDNLLGKPPHHKIHFDRYGHDNNDLRATFKNLTSTPTFYIKTRPFIETNKFIFLINKNDNYLVHPIFSGDSYVRTPQTMMKHIYKVFI